MILAQLVGIDLDRIATHLSCGRPRQATLTSTRLATENYSSWMLLRSDDVESALGNDAISKYSIVLRL